MTPLLVAAALASAPGCPAALAGAAALPDAAVAGEAAALLDALRADGAGGPDEALREEALQAGLAGAAGRGAAGARFRAALERHCALAALPRLPAAGPAQRARAAEILDGPAYRGARADPEALRRRLRELWARILALLETGEAQRYAGFSRAIFLAAAAAAALVGLLALRRRRELRRAAPTAPAGAPARASDDRLEAAEEAAARGDGAAAVRLALLAALAALERAGAVPPGRALTNAELVERLRGAGAARVEAARTLSRLFDRTVYGGRAAAPADAAEALRAARALGAGVAR